MTADPVCLESFWVKEVMQTAVQHEAAELFICLDIVLKQGLTSRHGAA